MEKWLDPELWLKSGGVSTLLLVGGLFASAYIGRVIFLWVKPLAENVIRAHIAYVTASVECNVANSKSIETLADTVGDICPRVLELHQATRHKAEMISALATDPQIKERMETHLQEVRNLLQRKT